MLRDGRDCCDQGRGDPTRDRCGCHKWTEASDWRPQILLRKMARSCAPRRTRAGNGNIKSGSQSRQYMQALGISGEGPWRRLSSDGWGGWEREAGQLWRASASPRHPSGQQLCARAQHPVKEAEVGPQPHGPPCTTCPAIHSDLDIGLGTGNFQFL